MLRSLVKASTNLQLGRTCLFYPLRNWLTRRRAAADLLAWEHAGRPTPPPHIVKQQAILEAARLYHLSVLIETGTYYGDMVEAMKRRFHRIISIELSHTLFALARKRFKRQSHITIVHGDSGIELARLLPKVEMPALFWLDGHYSGGATARGVRETPVIQELEHIFGTPDLGHVIMIDDARCFGVEPGYPSLEELSSYVQSVRPSLQLAVKDDIIRLTPRE